MSTRTRTAVPGRRRATLPAGRRAAPRGRRALGAAAAGLVAVPVGVGLGVPYLTMTGVSAGTVAGLLVLVAGTASLALAVHDWFRVLSRPGAVAATLGLGLTLAVTLFTLGQAVMAVQVPRAGLGADTPADRALAYRDVRFGTTDGVELSGWYVPSRNGAAVALLHGAHSTRSAVLGQAAVLARHGFGVLLFDARGHGRSSGRAMEFGWYGDEDAAAAVSFLASRPDVTGGRIALLGLSMGGEEAIGAAAADDRVRAVVAEGATNRVAADEAWLSAQYGWRGDVQRGLEEAMYGITDLLTPADPPMSLRSAVAATRPRPVLLIAAGERPDEARADRYIAGGSPSTVTVWDVPGARHTGALQRDPSGWERRVTAFLTASLSVEPT
jgi:pimeloyl-ACP methyl ester carboxylesterase